VAVLITRSVTTSNPPGINPGGIAKTNAKGDWYGWQVEDGMGDGEVTFLPEIEDGVVLYKMARQLAKDFKTGVKVADAPMTRDDDGGAPSRDGDSDDM